MYKKLSEWQQQHRDHVAQNSTLNDHGVDPTVWAKSAPANPEDLKPDNDPTLELNKVRAEIAEINAAVCLSQMRFNHRAAGQPLSQPQYQNLVARKARLVRRLVDLELRCSVVRSHRRDRAEREDLLKAKAKRETLATVFMDMAKEMLADEVYQRVFIAAVHRHGDRSDG